MSFVTAEEVSSLSVPLLFHELSLLGTVLQVPTTELAGPSGGQTIIRVPIPRTANIQGRSSTSGEVEDLVSAPIVETPVLFDVEHIYDYAPITTHDLTLDIEDYMVQVARPQIAAVAEGAEAQLTAVMDDLPIEYPIPENPDNGDQLDNQIAAAVAALDNARVPQADRWLAVSPTFAARMTSPTGVRLTDYNGQAIYEALRTGIIGEYRGMTVVKNRLLSGFKAVAYHESAFAFASLRPQDLPGSMDNATYGEQGLTLRQAYLLNDTKGTSNTLVSLFAGAAVVDADRAVVLGESGS